MDIENKLTNTKEEIGGRDKAGVWGQQMQTCKGEIHKPHIITYNGKEFEKMCVCVCITESPETNATL